MASTNLKVARIADEVLNKEKTPAITVFVHEDGTVSVGLSGDPENSIPAAKLLQTELDKKYQGIYRVSGESIPTQLIQSIENGCPKGICSESKVAIAASQSTSFITGMDTVWRGEKKNSYPFSGTNVGGKVKGPYEQMDPCNTCADPNNARVYMNVANQNKTASKNPKGTSK